MIDYETIYEGNTKLYEKLTQQEIKKFIEEKQTIENTSLIDPKYYFPRKNMITLAGGDKTGKGTMANHLAYALSELGHDVLITPFPNYAGFGLFIEMMSSFKKMKELVNENPHRYHFNVEKWEKNLKNYWGLYPLDRLGSANEIENALDEGKIVITKRGSIITHTTYQEIFNGVTDEPMIKGLDGGFPNPEINIALHSPAQLMKDFSSKGSSSRDYYESLSHLQEEVVNKQADFIIHPEKAKAMYGMFVQFLSPAKRLDSILKRIVPLISTPTKTTTGSIEIFGLEESPFDFRDPTGNGLEDFLKNADGAFFLDLLFNKHKTFFDGNDSNRYNELFTFKGKIDKNMMKEKSEIDKIINNYKG